MCIYSRADTTFEARIESWLKEDYKKLICLSWLDGIGCMISMTVLQVQSIIVLMSQDTIGMSFIGFIYIT